MIEQKSSGVICIEQIPQPEHLTMQHRIQKDSLRLADVTIRFSRIERVPRYDSETRETDVEHSFMLGLVAQEIAERYYPELDAGLVTRFSLVHDLLELETGDIPTFHMTPESLAQKAANEKCALEKLLRELPRATSRLLELYEEQRMPEARFVRLVDKLMPLLVDILGPGSQVMHEDYATHTIEQLNDAERALTKRFESMFPDPFLKPMHVARAGLAQQFQHRFKPIPAQEALF